jgi:hypothetical protein
MQSKTTTTYESTTDEGQRNTDRGINHVDIQNGMEPTNIKPIDHLPKWVLTTLHIQICGRQFHGITQLHVLDVLLLPEVKGKKSRCLVASCPLPSGKLT